MEYVRYTVFFLGGLGLGMIIDAMWIIGRDERKRKQERKNEI